MPHRIYQAAQQAQQSLQHIQQIAQQLSQQNQRMNQFGYQQQGGFSGQSSMMQSGFVGTNPQKVRQDIANDLQHGNQSFSQQGGFYGQQSGYQQQGGFYGQHPGYQQQGGFSGQPSMMQSGFVGTNPQKVRQDIANDLHRGNQSGF